MKPKHIAIRVAQCVQLSEASNCPRRKFGALLLDPVRNVVLMDGYNGAPRGGGALCAGTWCRRDGAPTDPNAYQIAYPGSAGAMEFRLNHGVVGSCDITDPSKPFQQYLDEFVPQFAAQNPPIPSGTHIEQGCHHAEMNVICNAASAGVKTQGGWLIVTGEPCLMCSKLIHHAGIEKVMCVKGGYKSGTEGIAYLQQYNITVEYVDGPQDPRSET